MSTAICIAPARTLAYPQGGGHLWVYLNWALGLRALGCRVIWLEGIDAQPGTPAAVVRAWVQGLKHRLARYGLADHLAFWSWSGGPVPLGAGDGYLDLQAAAEA